MKITLVSHASLLVESRGVRILSDPWYQGRIYGDAWELSPPPASLPDLAGLDAIYLSHAHPDHFHVPTLKSLLPATGADVAVLVPKLIFPVMRDALRAIGFRNVKEIAPGGSLALAGVRVSCQQFRFNDSLLVIQADETLVNLNDCPVRGRTLQALAERFPQVDYVFAQFSVAQALPYAYEPARPDGDETDLVERFDGYARALRPRHMVPFASFVRFCHADNLFMNAHATTLERLSARSTSPLTVLYPGDSIEAGRVTRAPSSRERYEQALTDEGAVAPAPVEWSGLERQLAGFLAGLRSLIPTVLRKRIPPALFVFADAPGGVRLDLAALRFERVEEAAFATSTDVPLAYRLAMSTLAEAVSSPWGWSNLQIGAKFRARVEPGCEGRESLFWMLPMLGLEGYLRFTSPWFLRPRTLGVAWGRRRELLEYAARALRGSFMSDVVRRKGDYARSRTDASHP